jgi:Glycosyltransferase family 87
LRDHPLANFASRTPPTQSVSPRRVPIALCFLALGIWALADFLRLGNDLPWRTMYDFPDFYCAGSALDAGQNPYAYEPLRSCEHRLNETRIFHLDRALAVPAPQPPYDFPPFMALAKLTLTDARAVYAFCIAAAILLTALVLSRLRIPLDVALASLALSTGFIELDAGQLVAFVLLFVVLAGWLLAERRDPLAGFFAGLTAVEPHLGLSVVVALLLFVPRARTVAIATVLGLAAAGVRVAGTSGSVLYLAHVLPEQAAAEVRFPFQYSLTYVLHTFGASDTLALALGTLSFFAALIAGLWLAPRTAAALRRRELLVYLPAAAAVVAGAYVHMVELCFAIPAALVFARWSRGTVRIIAIVAACCLAVPWIPAWGMKKLLLASVFVCAVLVYRLRAPASAIVAVPLVTAASLYVLERHPPALAIPTLAHTYAANAVVQGEWQAFVRGLDSRDPRWILIKLPTWGGFAALLFVALRAARRTSDMRASAT